MAEAAKTEEQLKSDEAAKEQEVKDIQQNKIDELNQKIAGMTQEEKDRRLLGYEEHTSKLNGEGKRAREELEALKKEIKEKEDKKLEDNNEFKELSEKLKGENNDLLQYKAFHDKQMEIITSEVTEKEGKLSTEQKEIYAIAFKENSSMQDKLAFLNKIVGVKTGGTKVDDSVGGGGTHVDTSGWTITDVNNHYVRTGQLLKIKLNQ